MTETFEMRREPQGGDPTSTVDLAPRVPAHPIPRERGGADQTSYENHSNGVSTAKTRRKPAGGGIMHRPKANERASPAGTIRRKAGGGTSGQTTTKRPSSLPEDAALAGGGDPTKGPTKTNEATSDRPPSRRARKGVGAADQLFSGNHRRPVRRAKPSGGSDPADASGDLLNDANQSPRVPGGEDIPEDHSKREDHAPAVLGGDRADHAHSGDQSGSVGTVATIRELWKRRQAWHTAEKRLTLQASAICRRFVDGDKAAAGKLLARIEEGSEADDVLHAAIAVAPLLAARGMIESARKPIERQLERMAKGLPVTAFVVGVRGVGLLSLAAIVGEVGDLSEYRSHQGVWKRMGLAVIGAERQRMKPGAEALEHGYSPRRRSVMWNIGNGLIGAMGKGPRPRLGEDVAAREDWTPYQRMFVERLRYEAARDPETHAREPVERKGEVFESFSSHAAARAKRYVEKAFLRDLYQQWKREVRPCA